MRNIDEYLATEIGGLGVARADGLGPAAEMQSAGICRDCEVNIVAGPEDYLYGEEKALLEVIEGRAPLPRLFPLYEHGLFATDIVTGWEGAGGEQSGNRPTANPTLVNN